MRGCVAVGGGAPQVAIVARHRQLELRSYVAELERLEALGTSREFDALCRALRVAEALAGCVGDLWPHLGASVGPTP